MALPSSSQRACSWTPATSTTIDAMMDKWQEATAGYAATSEGNLVVAKLEVNPKLEVTQLHAHINGWVFQTLFLSPRFLFQTSEARFSFKQLP
jgi:hypothetical protein